MWTEDHKRSDANHIAWINLIWNNTTHCAKLGLMKAQDSYIDTSSAESTTQGLFGGFSFRCLKKLKWGDSSIHSTAQRKQHGKTQFEKKNSENEFGDSETFYRSKFSPATSMIFGVWLSGGIGNRKTSCFRLICVPPSGFFGRESLKKN